MDSEWLKAQFTAHPDKTKADLADALKLGASAVSKILAGTRQIKAQEYAAMRRFFGLPVDGERAVSSSLYVVKPLQPGLTEKNTEPSSSENWMIPARLLQSRTQAPPDKIRVFAVQDNAMAPQLASGEWILVDLSDTRPSPPGIYVVSDGFGHMIRHCEFIPHSSPPAVRLSASGSGYAAHTLPLDRAGLIGRAIAKLEWL